MSPLRAIAVVALGLGGVALAVASLPRFRRPRLTARLVPYLGTLSALAGSTVRAPAPRGTAATLVRAVVEDLGARLHRLLGDESRDLETRLAAAGVPLDPPGFRVQQAAWGLVGLAAGLAISLLAVASGRAVSPVAALGAVLAFGIGGVAARDRALTRAARQRRERARAEFPTFVDMVCVAVTAGESLRAALDAVAASGAGPLAVETRIALREAHTGRRLGEALGERARRLGVAEFERFVDAVLAAQERGFPLADALRAMAFDVREHQKRTLIEAAGRKQVSMLVPVVVLILPVALAFAFFPGVVAIKTLAR